jgi:hypothetical protein
VINVDGHPAYARAMAEVKSNGRVGAALSMPILSLLEQHH